MKNNKVSKVAGILIALSSALATQGASAADDGWYSDKRFLIWARAFFASTDTTIRVDSQTTGLSGTLLDLESDLGIDNDETLPMVGVQWRFAKKHVLDLAYFELNRSSHAIVNEQLRWENFVYPIDANVSSILDTRVTCFAYLNSLVSDSKTVFAIGGSIHWTEMEADISAVGVGSELIECGVIE